MIRAGQQPRLDNLHCRRQFEEPISKLEDCHEGDDEDQLINEMEARGEIPSAEDFRAGRIRVIVHLKLFQPGQPALRSPSSM
jgi:hypothetical protein